MKQFFTLIFSIILSFVATAQTAVESPSVPAPLIKISTLSLPSGPIDANSAVYNVSGTLLLTPCLGVSSLSLKGSVPMSSKQPIVNFKQKIYQFSLPVKKWVGPTVVTGALAGSFIGGILHGKGEWELAEKGWPRSPESHHWRDAGNWTTGASCAAFGVGIILNGKTNWKEMLFGGLGMGFSNWLGTRVGYYKMRHW